MATFRLHRFSHVHTLKAIQPSYLLALLEPHQAYFKGRGVELGAVNGHELDYEGLRDVLMTLDPSAPQELMDDLYYVHEMSDDNGMDELLAAIEELPASERVELHLPPDPTPADVAVQVRLQAPELLERRHAERLLTKKRSFEYYQPKEGANLTFQMPTKKQLTALEGALDDRLDQLKRGRNSKVFIYEKDDGVWFLVRHGQPCRREGTVTKDGSGTVYFRPEIYDVLRYDPQSGDLSLNAETKKIGLLYREKIGLHLFGDATFFPGTAKYTLEPLLQDGEDCLVCSDVEGMEWVKLKEVHYAWGGPESEIEIRKANDLFAAYRRRDRSLPKGRLIRANFAVKFTDSKTPRTVSIRPSNVASFTRDGDSVLVEHVVFDEAHKYIESPDLVAGLVEVVREMRHKGTSIMVASQDPPSVPVSLIELSSQIFLHKFNSPAWLKHIQKANAALGGLTPEKMSHLRPGEAYVWSSKATDESFTKGAVKVKLRPRVTQHGGATKTAVEE